MKGTLLTLLVSGTVLLAACSGTVMTDALSEAPAVPQAAPASTPAEIPVSIPLSPESEPAPIPESPPQESVTPAPIPEPEPPASEPASEPEAPALPEVGNKAPDFTLLNPDGTTSTLSDLGQPVMLNFWNTGCKPCRSEMPYLEEIYEANHDTELFLLTINIGQNPDSVKAFLQENNLRLPVAFDTSARIARAYQIQYIPTTFLIDRDGVIQGKVIGAFRDKAAIEKKLEIIMPDDDAD
jgi:cytochrome c biogenesis protein CcmG, thiol:disulfide interchange protein DsbE